MEVTSKIYIAGHRGMVGSALERKFRKEGFNNIVSRTSSELDLRNQQAVNEFFEQEKPEYVILAAAKVGGIFANSSYRGEFIYDNLMIEANVIHAAYLKKVTKLLFLGSSCIYPKIAPQPLKEEYLLSGHLEPTNQPYAIAKIAGIELCQSYRAQYGCNFISAMPTNLYGTNDNYDLKTSHVLPALIRKFSTAEQKKSPHITVWGTGAPMREFLHVDDLAEACFFLMQSYSGSEIINIGTGRDISIKDLVKMISSLVNYQGKIIFDKAKPDGTFKKLLDISKIKRLGWNAKINLEKGLERTLKEVQKKNSF
jgi:GDP-L-fucose synthase